MFPWSIQEFGQVNIDHIKIKYVGIKLCLKLPLRFSQEFQQKGL